MYFIFDLDDTLLRSDKTISSYTKNILQKCLERGDKIIINTARDYNNAHHVAEEIDAEYIIANGGAEIYRKSELIYSDKMSSELVTKIAQELFFEPQVHGATVQADFAYTRDEEYAKIREDAFFFDFHQPFTKEAGKIIIGTENEQQVRFIAEKYNLILTRYFDSEWYRLSKTTKGSGLKKLLNILEIGSNEKAMLSVAFGDDSGDRDMLEAATIGVALKGSSLDASGIIKNVTDYSCDEDGCARYIEKNFLKPVLIFDLDGTILDTIDDLTNSVNYALSKIGQPLRSVSEVKSFVGWGLRALAERAVLPGTEEKVIEKVYNTLVSHYKEHCNDLTKPYDGILPMLKNLKGENYALAVVSNKADFAVKELVDIHFSGLFDYVVGLREGKRKKPAPDTVVEVLDYFHRKPEEAVYVGDSEVDVETANNARTGMIAVTWGFREKNVLKKAGAIKCAGNIEELVNYIDQYKTI